MGIHEWIFRVLCLGSRVCSFGVLCVGRQGGLSGYCLWGGRVELQFILCRETRLEIQGILFGVPGGDYSILFVGR